ncbi:hypothetical protein [Aquabacterium sp.]|uniref:hypothetical protein n=1 Tax=Aquabacterium sp. TaxID=1872578 RepID=UPI002B54C743|nr:hypothetical protein [Aquabacterium sp.]HSW03582.1 hypothetical protein [Aquabacterium sp.]
MPNLSIAARSLRAVLALSSVLAASCLLPTRAADAAVPQRTGLPSAQADWPRSLPPGPRCISQLFAAKRR